MFAGVRAIATALAMVSVSCAAVAQGVPPGAQIVPPSDQPGRERERFERPLPRFWAHSNRWMLPLWELGYGWDG